MLDEAFSSQPEPLNGPSRDRSPLPGPSRTPTGERTTSPTLPASVPHPTTPPRNLRRRRQEASIAYTEEALEALKTVGSATTELINRLNTPSDELDGVRTTIGEWTPERRKRFLLRVRRMVTEEEEDRFRRDFGYFN
uniref:Uncharacterized protein n=1 Tax=Anopheles maculatus TaxID=74869 RepID=A0A182TAE5_9DIPT